MAQLDYATVTLPKDCKTFGEVALMAHEMIMQNCERDALTAVRFKQYSGISCGDITAMYSDDYGIIRVSGSNTESHLARLLTDDCHLTRIDLQQTQSALESPNSDIMGIYIDFRAALDDGLLSVRNYRLIESHGEGMTLEIGSRTSDTFVRIYNKEAESPDKPEYQGCLRYEVEVKNKVAKVVEPHVKRWYLKEGGIGDRARAEMSATLSKVMSDRGVPMGYVDHSKALDLKVERRRSDAETKLEWLRTAVSPTLRWLVQRGMQKEALEALGITIKDGSIDIPTANTYPVNVPLDHDAPLSASV